MRQDRNTNQAHRTMSVYIDATGQLIQEQERSLAFAVSAL